MEKSKQFLKDHGILPRISFEKGKPRTLKIIDEKTESFNDKDDKLVEGMKYKVTENGEPKTIFSSAVSLISKLAEIEPDSVVTITQKGYKQDGEWRTTYDVVSVIDDGEMPKSPKEEIPIVEDNVKEEVKREAAGL